MENNMSELLKLFYDKVSPEDMLYSKLSAHITSQIIRQRMIREMNQKQFADFLGCTQAYISKLENGNCNFTLGKLCELAVKLDLDISVDFVPNTEKIARKVVQRARQLEKKENSWTSLTEIKPSMEYKRNLLSKSKEICNNV